MSLRQASVTAITRRLSQQARRQDIVEQATRFFAENGFGATTRALAERMGVTQPLLFQHFPTKADLVAAVFDALYERMSAYDWFEQLRDPSRALRARLVDFFHSYATTLYDYHWIRIYMFAGLEGGAFNRMYITRLTEPLLREIAVQIRIGHGCSQVKPDDVTPREIELLWMLHGGLYYSAIRKQIYGMPVAGADIRQLIEYTLDSILLSMKQLLSDLDNAAASGPAPVRKPAQRRRGAGKLPAASRRASR